MAVSSAKALSAGLPAQPDRSHGSVATLAGPMVNVATSLMPVKRLLHQVMHISSQRVFPKYEQGTFRRWFLARAADQKKFEREVVYFHGCYVNYNDHGLGKDVVRVLNAMKYGVSITREKCCGVPLIANGDMVKARKNAAFNIHSLSQAVRNTDRKNRLRLIELFPGAQNMNTRTCSGWTLWGWKTGVPVYYAVFG